MIKKVSIVIPVFKEERTIRQIISRVLTANTLGLTKEIIVVDDGSKDGTKKILLGIKAKNVKIIFCKNNHGKGSALRTGFKKATGEIIIIQDADLEYHPKDYPKLIRPILDKKTDIVYGSRELSWKNIHSSIFFHFGGKIITEITNILYGSRLSDEATGYKVFRTEFLKKLPLKCKRFEFCPEVTALVLKKGGKILEVPNRYSARHRRDGKKIGVRDGISAILTLLRIKMKGTLWQE